MYVKAPCLLTASHENSRVRRQQAERASPDGCKECLGEPRRERRLGRHQQSTKGISGLSRPCPTCLIPRKPAWKHLVSLRISGIKPENSNWKNGSCLPCPQNIRLASHPVPSESQSPESVREIRLGIRKAFQSKNRIGVVVSRIETVGIVMGGVSQTDEPASELTGGRAGGQGGNKSWTRVGRLRNL